MTLDRAFIKAFSDTTTTVRRHDPAEEAIVATLVAEAVENAPIVEPAAQLAAVAPPHTAGLRPARTSLTRAPLSSFTLSPTMADRLQPGLEVEGLTWPQPCIELLTRARRGWDRFVERLLEPAAERGKCFAITSCVRGEGRTTAVLTAARHLAARGLQCVVVDADFENPLLAQCLGLTPQAGWADFVVGELPLGEALIASPAEGITLVPWQGHGPQVVSPSNPTRVATCFESLRTQFDVVLVDAMPLLSGPVMSSFVQLAEPMHLDAVYLIYDTRYTTPKQLKDVSARLQRAGFPPAGVIENFAGSTNPPDDGSRDRLPSFVKRTLNSRVNSSR